MYTLIELYMRLVITHVQLSLYKKNHTKMVEQSAAYD